jgi:hypothetical protein
MDPDPGGPKTCGSDGSGSGTLKGTITDMKVVKKFTIGYLEKKI